jgi:hypothetical protein
MIRTFRVYELAKLQKLSVTQARERLEEARLGKIGKTAPSRLSRLLSDLAEKLKGERIEGPRNHTGHWEMTLRGRWPARRATVAAGPQPHLAVEVPIWLRKTSGWVVIFEANRALCDAAVFLLADALSGNVENVSGVSLEQMHWQALDSWLQRAGGELLGGRFYKTRAAGTELEWIALRRAAGSEATLLRESFEGASGIGEMLIHTPHLPAIDNKITCRIGRTANIRVYGSDISDGTIEALLLELEGLWEGVPSDENKAH